VDLIEIDAASNNSVDDVRELRDKVNFRPAEGDVKIYIIDEVHMLSPAAFNALLKTLEEPPDYVRFILATTEPHKIPATVLSRCQRFDFRRIPVPEIASHLRHILNEEQRQAEDEALTAIARSAQGCMRDAVSLLDQMMSGGEEVVTFAQVQEALGAVSTQHVSAFVDALADRDVPRGLTVIHGLTAGGASLSEFCRQVIEHLRGVLVQVLTHDAGLLAELPADSRALMERQASRMTPPTILFAIRRFVDALQEMKGDFQPQLPLEMALIESIEGPPVVAQAAEASQSAPPKSPAAQASSHHVVQPGGGQAKAATPVAQKEPPAGPVDEQAVEQLRVRMRDFLKLVKARCGIQVQGYLNSWRDIAIAGDRAAFALGNNEFSLQMLSKPETQAQVEAVLSEFLGSPFNVEFQIGDRAKLAMAANVAPAVGPRSGPDPLVEFAVSELHAEVKPGSRE
jgi:DNA polymerase-3 subunit gamma/tau